jgi:hypothetical protein
VTFEIQGGTWFDRVPPPAFPVSAAERRTTLNGAAAQLARRGLGLLTDLRINGEAFQHQGVWHVDLQSEQDYWRARLHPGTPTPSLRSQLSRVWIEERAPDFPDAPGSPSADPYEVWQRLAPGPDAPCLRRPVPARTVRHLHGRRIIQVTPLGWAWNLRAISEPYDRNGEITVNCCSAEHYYRWLNDGRAADVAPLPLYVLWTE